MGLFKTGKKIVGKVLGVAGGVIAGKKGEEVLVTENLSELSQLSPRAQVWRSITRPIISFSIIAVILLGVLISYGEHLAGVENPLEVPKYIISFGKWVLGFWFGSRGIEKILGKVL